MKTRRKRLIYLLDWEEVEKKAKAILVQEEWPKKSKFKYSQEQILERWFIITINRMNFKNLAYVRVMQENKPVSEKFLFAISQQIKLPVEKILKGKIE